MNNFSSVMRPVSEPRGASLASQATAFARTAQIREFGNGGAQRPAPSQFPLLDVVDAIGRGNQASRIAATVALQEFMGAPAQLARRFRAQLRELVTVGDMPTGATMQAYIDRFLITPGEMDNGWMELFATHDVAASQAQLLKGSFKVLNVTSGIVFKKRLPGEPVDFRSITATEAEVSYDMFGGGVSIERVLWDDADYLPIGDILTMFREGYYFKQAGDMYGLLTAVSSGQNYSTGSDLTAKINGACAAIIRGLQGKGYAVNTNSTFYLVFAPEQRGNVDAVLAVKGEAALTQATSKTRLQYRCVPLSTVHVPATGTGSGIYVVLPKNQMKAGIRMDLTLFGQFSPASYCDDIAGFGRYAGVIADTGQVRRIPTE